LIPHSLRMLGAAALTSLALAASAQTFSDPQWEALLEAGKVDELGRLAQARLHTQPTDPQATLAVGLAAMGDKDDARLEAAVKQAERCVQAQPNSAVCHYALGSVLGTQAMRGGMLKAMRLVGSVKGALTKAVELDPLHADAREALLQFYLAAPGVAGGSVDKAREVAQQAQARQPELTKLLLARVAMHEKQWDQAEQLLAGVRAGDDKNLQAGLREGWGALGAQWMQQKQPARAKPVFERLQREHAAYAIGAYGLGRALLELGAADEALAQLERARPLKGADRFPIDYRVALAWLQKGDKGRAKPLLERFVSAGKGHPANLEDARKRLAELG